MTIIKIISAILILMLSTSCVETVLLGSAATGTLLLREKSFNDTRRDAVIASKFILENIFELAWAFDFKTLIYLGLSIGLVTLLLIMLTNLKYLNPKVYPLIRNQ